MTRDRNPNYSRMAVIHLASGPFSKAVTDGVENYASCGALNVVFKREYQRDISDFSALVADLKLAKADVILGVGRLRDDILLAQHLVHSKVMAGVIALVATPMRKFKEALGVEADGFFWYQPVGSL